MIYAGHPAPGVQVLVNLGGATVFKGITDTTGQFSTGALEPGVYAIEVRGPKVVPPVRYFLVLSGARPVGQTMTNAAGDLAMQAQVRRPTSLRGQVSANRIIVLPGGTPPPGARPVGLPVAASLSSSPRPVSQPAVASQKPSANVATAPVRAAVPNAAAAVVRSTNQSPVMPSPRANLPQPATVIVPSARPASSPARSIPQTAPIVTGSVAATQATGYRIIGGKRYLWVPSAPGSNLGHWVLATPQPGGSNASGSALPTTSSISQGRR